MSDRKPYSQLHLDYRCIRFVLFAAMMVVKISATYAQAFDSTMVSPDNVFSMKVVRENNQVLINLSLLDTTKFRCVMIERKPEFDQSFSRFKYLPYETIMAADNHCLKTEDTYPYPPSTDVMYRLKLVTIDGGILIYPALSLPGNNNRALKPTSFQPK